MILGICHRVSPQRHQIQLSVSLVLPTESSEVDHGMFETSLPSEDCGYEGAPVKLLLRPTLPQLPALPDRTWWLRGTALLPETRSFGDIAKDVTGFVADGVDGEVKSRSTSVPLNEWRELGLAEDALLRRWKSRVMRQIKSDNYSHSIPGSTPQYRVEQRYVFQSQARP